MRKQKAIAVAFNVVDGKLSCTDLEDLLEQGWTVNSTAESGIGPVLVILDAPKEEVP